MFCKNCGNEIKDGVKFCSKCGTEQVIHTDFSEKSDNETIENNTDIKNKPGVISYILAIVIIIALIWGAITGVRWVFSTVGSWLDGKDGMGKQSSERTDAGDMIPSYAEPAIIMNDISFNTSMSFITYEFENISDKDIAYITFETYFYDRMGGALETTYGDAFSNLEYTGPVYAGSTDSAYWEYLFSMPSGTAVVYPKKITVTFVDDEEITFENTLYCHTDDFYGGELKDKK